MFVNHRIATFRVNGAFQCLPVLCGERIDTGDVVKVLMGPVHYNYEMNAVHKFHLSRVIQSSFTNLIYTLIACVY